MYRYTYVHFTTEMNMQIKLTNLADKCQENDYIDKLLPRMYCTISNAYNIGSIA